MTGTGDRKTCLQKKKEVGQVSAALIESAKEQSRIKTKIISALKKGPLTIPEISDATGLDIRTVYYVMTLRRYGQLMDCDARGDYYSYSLKGV